MRCFTILVVILGMTMEVHLNVYLGSVGYWDYYKVNVAGVMTSTNVKQACEDAGFVAPCPGSRSSCRLSGGDCIDTGLRHSSGQCSGWFYLATVICGNSNPQRCLALNGVYMYYHNWSGGSACGVEIPGSSRFKCVGGIAVQNKFALCANQTDGQIRRQRLKDKLLRVDSILHDALADFD